MMVLREGSVVVVQMLGRMLKRMGGQLKWWRRKRINGWKKIKTNLYEIY